MPRDAETNKFLVSLERNKGSFYWIGLHDQRSEGKFEWVDGSALGKYSSWTVEQPDSRYGDEDCVAFSSHSGRGHWYALKCHYRSYIFCQVAPERLTSSGRNCSYLHKLIWKSLLDLGTNLEPWDQLALLEKKGPRGRLDRQEKRGPRSRLDRLEKREPWGRLVLCLSDLLDLQEKRAPWGRLVLCLSDLLDLQEKRAPWGRLVLCLSDLLDLQEKRAPWGRLVLCLSDLLDLEEKRAPWGRLVLCLSDLLDLEEKMEPWGRLVLQEKRDRLALCLLGHPDLQGRLVCQETRFALDQLDEVRH
uniref:C-type lectin domain-containing protein n=1 Tax=Branchiostoma floridae TaxID=7739 RepID=C3ZMH7_BRAFL|eukprot:XP_002590261.1 hypothetical protein BRAFLDRAFT_109335 [Branchiostoma floridae]